MSTQSINEWGLIELDSNSQVDITGGNIIGDVGYACGYLAGAATNAAKILGDTLWDTFKGIAMDKALRR